MPIQPIQPTRQPNPRQPATPQPLAAVAAQAGHSRLAWADTAKGVCILLVVAWHVVMKHYLQIDWRLPVPLTGVWGLLGDTLLPLRMPLFFTISGMFAVAAASRPWAVIRRSRIGKFYYLYAVWFVVHTVVLQFTPRFDTLASHDALDMLEQLTITPTNLWYLVALALYFVVAKLTLRVPSPAILGAALLLSVVASAGWLDSPGNRGQLYQNLFFFLAGMRLRSLLTRWSEAATLRLMAGTAALFVVVTLGVRVVGAKEWFGVWPALCMVAVLAGVAGAVHLQRWRTVSVPLARLGRQTLPIYVMHMPVVALADLALRDPLSRVHPAVQFALAIALPIVMTAVVVAFCLLAHERLQKAGARWLFDLPGVTGCHRTRRRRPPGHPHRPTRPAIRPSRATEPAYPAARNDRFGRGTPDEHHGCRVTDRVYVR